MNKLIAATATLSTTAASAKIGPETMKGLADLQRDGIAAGSSLGRHLIQKSRRVEQAAAYAQDISFVSDYSIKFQGCHHVTQWASEEEMDEEEGDDYNADDGDGQPQSTNSRIRSKGLVRYRLCPTDSCFEHFSMGCSSNYGEYVVDMISFLEVYIAYQMEMNEYNCEKYSQTCFTECYESTSANCYQKCYKKYDVNAALCSSNGSSSNNQNAYSNYDSYAASSYGGNEFDLETYIQCGEYEVATEDGDAVAHYLGPYCADQGGDIKLGFFQDATCSIPSSYQATYFEKLTGIEIPYTKKSLVETSCLACASTESEADAQGNQDYYNYDANGNRNYYVAKEVNEMCGSMYMTAGKCETNFDPEDQPYPEEGACNYIESVRQLQTDGIIRTDQKRHSKPAAVATGVFTGTAVLLGGYVYHLKSMIARSAVNLSGATTSLA